MESLILVGLPIVIIGLGFLYVYKYNKRVKSEENEIITDLTAIVKSADNALAEKMAELTEKNSVVFECPCKHNLIKVFIDLSKEENTFICPECKNTYRVDIKMTPILKGKIVDEHNLYNLLSEKAINHE